MKRFKQFLNEKEDLHFDYTQIARDIWYKLIKDAQDKFKIWFDLENDDPTSKSKVVQYNTNDCTFLYRIYKAGGDWQTPTVYFRCQLKSGTVKDISPYNKNAGCFIFIPNIEQGNDNLVSNNKNTGLVPEDDNKNYKNQNEQKCVKALKEYLDSISKD